MDVTCMLLRLTLCMVHYVSGVAAVPRDRTMGLDISGSQDLRSQDLRSQDPMSVPIPVLPREVR